MKKINRKFFYKQYSDSVFYCFYMKFTVKIIHIFGRKLMYISHLGYDIDILNTKKESIDFINKKKFEYIAARKYIQK